MQKSLFDMNDHGEMVLSDEFEFEDSDGTIDEIKKN